MGLTPKAIVKELDKFIVGQHDAKKAVAVALRNRYRRKFVAEELRDEIVPKNILMIGHTGIGKTEIARRLARLSDSPFIKVEATKFTEIGYVGRDVDSIIRDLTEIAVMKMKDRERYSHREIAKEKAIARILDSLVGKSASVETREKFYQKLINNQIDNVEIEINVKDQASGASNFEMPGMSGTSMGIVNISDVINKAFGSAKIKSKKMTIKEALEVITCEEADSLVDDERINRAALKLVENDGIVFLDEIDKITSRAESSGGKSEISREGVQRDLLPLIEGTTVNTKYGPVKTDYILFIASGAFHLSKPSDLLPELQGRLPVRVELHPLTKDDLIKILTEPHNSLIKQYQALMATEDVQLIFTEDGINTIASLAAEFNDEVENIGARRLHTILEKMLEDISFNAAEMQGGKVIVNDVFVRQQLANHLAVKHNLEKFIL